MKDRIAMFELAEYEAARTNDEYPVLLAFIQLTFNDNLGNDPTEPLFMTNASGLFDLFLDNLPEEARQHYNCRACRNFVDRFGGLVRITKNGALVPLMWDRGVPSFFSRAIDAIRARIFGSRVTGVFIPEGKRLGTPVTGDWHHMHVELSRDRWHKDKLRTPYQVEAAKAEDHRLLCEAIDKYKLDDVKTAVNLLHSGSLYRGDKVKGAADWFLGVMNSVKNEKSRLARYNLLWRAAATAPTGFCHISGSMLGNLLDDVAAGMDFEKIKRRFEEKMDPLKYQRPHAAPTVGNIAEAEKIVEKLGVAASLKRRFARLEEIETIWKPTAIETPSSGVFGHLLPKKQNVPMVAKGSVMTWEKFNRTILPDARKIEFLTDHRGFCNYYSALITAVDQSAPPILQWDSEERRNPVSWYVYNFGSDAESWNLPNHSWVEVTGITLQPNLWQPGFEYHGKGVLFILKGCKDMRYKHSGLGLFPEVLKSELREIRSTIEAYSRAGMLEGYEEASACGVRLAGKNQKLTLRVTTDLGTTEYTIDRWD